jgi:hypothetical protein
MIRHKKFSRQEGEKPLVLPKEKPNRTRVELSTLPSPVEKFLEEQYSSIWFLFSCTSGPPPSLRLMN